MITKKKHRAEVALVTEQLQKTQALLKDASEQNSHLEMQISTLKTLMREDEERNKKQLDPSGASIHEEPSKAIKEKIKSLEQKDLEQTQIIADLNAKLKQMQEAAAEAAPKPTDAGDDDDEKEGEKAAPPPAPPVPTADVEPDTNDDERAAKDSALIKELEQKVKEYAEKADELASELEKTKESHGSDLQAILQRLTDKEVQLAEKSDEVATLQQQVASSSKSLASKIQKSANQSLQKKVDALKKTNREASELAHTHQQQIKKLQSQLDERQSELRKLQQNLDSEKEVAEDLRGQLAVEKQSTADLQVLPCALYLATHNVIHIGCQPVTHAESSKVTPLHAIWHRFGAGAKTKPSIDQPPVALVLSLWGVCVGVYICWSNLFPFDLRSCIVLSNRSGIYIMRPAFAPRHSLKSIWHRPQTNKIFIHKCRLKCRTWRSKWPAPPQHNRPRKRI